MLHKLYARVKEWQADRSTKKSLAKLTQAFEALRFVDQSHREMGWGRRRCRQWWTEFIRQPEFRSLAINDYIKELLSWQTKH